MQSLPDLLRQSLENHIQAEDIKEDEELQRVIRKLNTLSEKVAAAKAAVLAKRQAQK